MADVHDPLTRSKNMRAISNSGTAIEKNISELLDNLGISYRIQVKELPGKPDFVIDSYQAIIFVHGCFWHGHNCHLFKVPKTRTNFWLNKISSNVLRDKETLVKLSTQGWKVLLIRECALRGPLKSNPKELSERVEEWLCVNNKNAVIDTTGIYAYDIVSI